MLMVKNPYENGRVLVMKIYLYISQESIVFKDLW